jgi:peptide-methionine (S)-S-oxide reductase
VTRRGRHFASPLAFFVVLGASACQQPALASEESVSAPPAQLSAEEAAGLKTTVFAGGCFWGVEGVFSHVKGVESAVSGYHGGAKVDASYRRVGTGKTGHAEAVRVTYDPAVVRYDQLLRIFFSVVADPTLTNRQGPDVGKHYRAALIPLGEEQRKVAAAYLAQMKKSGVWSKPIVTGIEGYSGFYPAESYHQDFMAKDPDHPYILRWDAPKVRALARLYPGNYRKAFKRG